MKTIRSYFKPKATPLKRSATVDSEEFSTPSVRKSARTEGKKDAKDHEDKENLLNQSGLPTLETDTSMKESLQVNYAHMLSHVPQTRLLATIVTITRISSFYLHKVLKIPFISCYSATFASPLSSMKEIHSAWITTR
eukprot:1359590-Amorphochlora_amoeboformis.AAC.1